MVKRILLPALLLLCTFSSRGQTADIVKSDSITFPVHKENIGRIAFMGEIIPIEKFLRADFLKKFELKERTDFNIRIFMGNSLTNYLHQLAPALSAEELAQKGNYQFSFYVDDKLIYTENLHYNAGSAENKNKRTVLRIPLISSTDEDSWGRFMWNRFMQRGGEEAFTTGEHLLKIEVRPYIRLAEIVTGNSIAEGQVIITVPLFKVDEELVRVQQISPNSGWQLSNESYDEDRVEQLNRKIAEKKFKDVTSIVVVKDGKLLVEEYFNGAGRDSLHDTRSVGKSFASALAGIAIRDGYVKSESQTLKDFYTLNSYPHFSSKKGDVSLKSLLTMSSAFDGSDMNEESPGNEEKMYPTNNWVDFTLGLPMDSTKEIGKNWDYFTAGVVLLGDILNKSVPAGLEKYAEKNLFQPLGITKYHWQYTPQNVVNTAGGLQLRSLDLAKFGQLYQYKGKWNGHEVIPEPWITSSLARQLPVPGTENEYYGYLFWNKTYVVNNVNYEVFYSSGNGGNKIFIFKDHPIVIVITSTAYNKPYGHSQVDKMMMNYLLPAIMQ